MERPARRKQTYQTDNLSHNHTTNLKNQSTNIPTNQTSTKTKGIRPPPPPPPTASLALLIHLPEPTLLHKRAVISLLPLNKPLAPPASVPAPVGGTAHNAVTGNLCAFSSDVTWWKRLGLGWVRVSMGLGWFRFDSIRFALFRFVRHLLNFVGVGLGYFVEKKKNGLLNFPFFFCGRTSIDLAPSRDSRDSSTAKTPSSI